MKQTFQTLAMVSSLLAVGCTDMAKPDLDRCEQLEREQKFVEAARACQEAHAKDPESTAGKLAQARLPLLTTKQREKERELAARDARRLRELHEAEERIKLGIKKPCNCPPGDALCSCL